MNSDPYLFEDDDSISEENVDLRKYIRAITKRWWLILTITLIILIPWILYLKSQPPIYEAEVLIRFKNIEGNDLGLTQGRKTELTSRSFAEKVVAQLGLSMNLEHKNAELIQRSQIFETFVTTKNPVAGDYLLKLYDNQSYEVFFMTEEEKEYLLQKGLINDITENLFVQNGISFRLVKNGLQVPIEIPFKIIPFRDAVKSFQQGIKVKLDRSGTLMTLTLTDSDPILVADMTNRLAEIFIEESVSLKKMSVQNRSALLQEQLKIVKQKLEASDQELKAFKEKYATTLNSDQKSQLNQLLKAESDKQNVVTIINTLNDLFDKSREESRAVNGDETDNYETNRRYIMTEIAGHAVFDDNATMLIYRQRLNDLEEQWKTIVSRTSTENYRAKQILEEIKQLHSQIATIAKQEIQSLNKELVSLNKNIRQQDTRLKQLPTQEYQLSELKRDNNVLEQQYLDLLAKTREAQISEAVETEDIEILDSAIVPEFPTNSDKKKKAALAGIFGIILGVTFALFLEFLDKSIKTPDEVKKYLKLNILGTIPQINFNDVYDFQDSEKIKQIDQQLVTHDYSPTPVGEAYRALRTNLMFSKDNGKIQSLVITSNEPGDGKSFTAANLAITLAQLKSNTLLIDSDLRRGVLHNTFGVPKEPGFSNYLTNTIQLQNILQETHIPNLTLISCGALIPNPSELLGSHQMHRFLDEIKRKFELIILDTPPLNAATDAVVIGTQVNGTLIVIRAGKTNRDIAKQKLELFTNVPAKVIGTVLNGTTEDMGHPGYSYYHY